MPVKSKLDADSCQRRLTQRRLTWRCRRGMLELDIVLQRFIASHFQTLDQDELHALDALLDLPDNEFWQLVSGQDTMRFSASIATSTLAVLAKINHSRAVIG